MRLVDHDHREPGCTVKGHKDRYVPLHPEILKRLIPYMERVVAEHGHGPLFRDVRKDQKGKRSTYVARKIDRWMDGVIKDPNLAPNHSFRANSQKPRLPHVSFSDGFPLIGPWLHPENQPLYPNTRQTKVHLVILWHVRAMDLGPGSRLPP